MAGRVLVGLMFAGLVMAACGGDGDSADTTTSSVAVTTTTTTTPSTTTTVPLTDDEVKLAAAEAFVDAFYSFNSADLEASLPDAESSIPFAVFYQGWAEGGNYEIVERMPCEVNRAFSFRVSCSITVRDDLAQALNLDFNVTDTFVLTFIGTNITQVDLESDDPELVEYAFEWVIGNSPGLFDGACAGFFEGGPTPGDCVETFVQGFEDFIASADFRVAFSADDALSVTDAYFVAYNAGDVSAVISLHTSDVAIDWFGDTSRADWEMITAFFVGQGTILTPPDCDVAEGVLVSTKEVTCEFETLTGHTQAVDALPVPTRFTAVVTPDGISRLTFSFGSLDFLHVVDPFNRWIAENHPEAIEATAFGDWTTVEEARQTGELHAEFSQEWAAYLEANDCGYLDGC